MPRPIPVYDFEISFAEVLGIRYETLRRYVELGVFRPDAQTTSGRGLFLAFLVLAIATILNRHVVSGLLS